MKLIKEPLEVDFLVQPIPLTDVEKLAITDFIKRHKMENKAKENSKKSKKKKQLLP